jgi:hypothetical protein
LIHFGVRPWEIDSLTPGEFNSLCRQAERIERRQ